MSCLSPIIIPAKFKGARPTEKMSVPCGKCIECLKAKQHSLIYRLQLQSHSSRYALFVTLTYDEKNVPVLYYDSNGVANTLSWNEFVKYKHIEEPYFTLKRSDIQNFMKRLRVNIQRSGYNNRFKHFYCGEYGDQFGRPHYHAALFFSHITAAQMEYFIGKSWQLGGVQVDYLTDSRIAYITKYMLKGDLESATNDFVQPCFSRGSHGLGIEGFEDDLKFIRHSFPDLDDSELYCQLDNGTKIPIPRYYRNTILMDNYPKFDRIRKEQIEYDLNKRNNEKYIEYCKANRALHPEISSETLARNYIQIHDSERKAYLSNIERRRRKGL